MNKISPKWLHQAQGFGFVLFAGVSAFMTYFSMYAFRKPFTASTYDSIIGFESVVTYKVALILAQVLGYLLAKFIGIKVIAEMQHKNRGKAILAMILAAELALVLFAITPVDFNIIWLFFNGLALGMVWGVVFSFLEGRRTTEMLGAVLSLTFILAPGVVRTVGKWLLESVGILELWMPAATGALFLPLLMLSVWCLCLLPKPNSADEKARQHRAPMNGQQRWAFFKKYAFGICCLILSFLLFTGLRDFRDNFSAEIWHALGYGQEPAIFAYAGIRIAFIVLIALGAMVLIRNNKTAFYSNHGFILFGIALLFGTTVAFEAQLIEAKTWMVWLGAGLYIAYIPYNCFLFDRMISAVGATANAGFLLYLADSAGYIGSVGILLYRTFATPDISWLNFFIHTIYAVAVIAAILVFSSGIYFHRILVQKNITHLNNTKQRSLSVA
ncbi:hypothetical protein KO527_25405 [Pseudoalteromonas sp. C2R02]|uniref:DUF5690 family protein n=1 Tax=Pseudoalteromonas sp. C2R02 TaxID=2841565 RepID=UPI001C085A3F|nr:DUF5690 family protein [Pseudoalteromonas sp. C2R02]MBU2972678.1 hypothetical protein [Pseudoalteromonas sp. C2R02]